MVVSVRFWEDYRALKRRKEINEFKIIVNLYNNSYPQLSINLLPTGKVKSDSILLSLTVKRLKR